MELNLKTGMTFELNKTVTEQDTAMCFGSGTVDVFATPRMIAWMEEACLKCVLPSLPKGFDTVGTLVNVSHLAATPVGMQVSVKAELTEIAGKRLTFHVVAHDEKNKIGEGTHGRAVVELEKFLKGIKGL